MSIRIGFHACLLAAILAGVGNRAAAQPPVAIRQVESEDSVSRFLKLNHLDDLQPLWLDRRLQNAREETHRRELAGELGQAYARLLLDEAIDSEHWPQVFEKLESLKRDYPETLDRSIDIALLQVEYRRAKSDFESWLAQRRELQQGRQSQVAFDAVIARSRALAQALNGEIERLDEPLETRVEGAEKRLWELENARSQANYVEAWASYYRGICTSEGEARARALGNAATLFERLLQMDQQNYEELNAAWIGLQEAWNARALVGLALAHQALSARDKADACFLLLADPTVAPAVRNHLNWWKFHSRFFPGQWDLAAALVDQLKRAEREGSVQPSNFWYSVAVAVARGSDQESEVSKRMLSQALESLVVQGDIRQALDLVRHHDVAVEGNEVVELWIQGQLAFADAEAHSDLATYRKAEKMMTALAVRLMDSQSFPGLPAGSIGERWRRQLQSQVIYSLAWCHFRVGEFEKAAEQFRDVADRMRSQAGSMTEQAMWMHADSLRRLQGSDPSARGRWIAALGDVVRRYPGSEHATQAQFLLNSARARDKDPMQRIAELDAVPVDDPNYERAQFEIIQKRRQIWIDSKQREDDSREAAAVELRRAAKTFLQTFPAARPESRLQVALYAVQSWSESGDNVERRAAGISARELLDDAKALLQQVEFRDDFSGQYHVQRLRISRWLGDADAADESARWLAGHPVEAAMRRAGLLYLASEIDRAWRDRGAPPLGDEFDRAIEVYAPLVDLLGQSTEALSDQPNARYALFRLAQLTAAKGEWEDAETYMTQLLQAAPHQLDYLVEAARIQMQLGDFEAARSLWRRIARGASAGSEAWFEAKLNLVRCLALTDADEAMALFRQTLQLAPTLPPRWQREFDKLGESLK